MSLVASGRDALRRVAKATLSRTLYRDGAVRTVLIGPSRGLRYRIFPNGRAPIYGGWEPGAQKLMARYVKPGMVAYDIGANAGIHSLLMARLVGPAGHVYAFEPVPSICESLKQNVALNGFEDRVTLVGLAAADCEGTMTFYTAHHHGAGHLALVGDAIGESVQVETVTLDAFVLERGNRPPAFIKIDVEGAEGRVFTGGRRMLEAYRPLLLVDLHNKEQVVAVGSTLADLGYTAYRAEDNQQVKNLTSGPHAHDGIWEQILAVP